MAALTGTIKAVIDTSLNPGQEVNIYKVCTQVDWGDGNVESNVSKHTYSEDGIYNITVLTSGGYSDSVPITYLFYNCPVVTEVEFLDDVIVPLSLVNSTSMVWALGYCTNLKKVTFGDGFEFIPDSCMYNCSALEEINLGSNIRVLGQNVLFSNRGSQILKKVNYASVEQVLSLKASNSYNLYYNSPNCKPYINGEELIDLVVPESISVIADYTLYGCRAIKTIKFLGNKVSDPKYGLYNLTNLEEVRVDNIEDYLNVELPMGSLFRSSGVKCTLYVDGVKVTGTLNIPGSVEKINKNAFRYMPDITGVVISDGVKIIDDSAFADTNIYSLTLPSTLTTIGRYAFSTNRLKNIVIPNSVTSIGNSAFQFYAGVSGYDFSVSIGSGLSSLPESLFSMSGDKIGGSIILTSNVKTISIRAFQNWDYGHTKVYYSGTLEEWNELLSNTNSTGNDPIKRTTPYITHILNYHTSFGELDPSVPNPSFVADLPDPLPSVTAANWIVGGWYYDRLFTNPATPGDVLSSDADLYIKLYNDITYDLNGGVNSALNPSVYTSSDVTNRKLLFAPMKIGYDFDGWYLDSAFSSPVEDMSDFDGSAITLYAKFVDHYFNVPMRKTENGVEPAHLDAYSVRGNDPYASINISSINTMEELYIKINTINAKNEHAYFDMSSHIPGAYVCLINIQDVGDNHYCEINDLLHNRVYYAYDGFTFTEDIDEYIERCLVKDNYVSIKISGLSNMGEMVEYINRINSNNDHAFFDFSEYIDNAYVCTIQCFTQSSINYCFVFDILGGKLYGRYTGYSDSETITDYVNSSEAESDIVHAIRITDPTITILKIIQLLNRVNQIGHHVFFDVSAISSMDYLISFTSSEDGSNTSCTAMGIVKGTIAKHTYATADLATTTLSSLLESGAPLGGMQLDLLWTNPNPASDFAAQTVNLDTTQYKMVMIVFRWHKSQSYYLTRLLHAFRDYTVSENLGESLATRMVTRTQTGFTFTTGRSATIKSIAEFNTVSENRGAMIPVEIYGIN